MITVKRIFKLSQTIIILSAMLILSPIPVLAQWTYNGDDIYNTTAGAVGIGTSSPRSINQNSILGLDSLTNTYFSINAPYESQSAIAFGDQTNGQDSVIYRPPSSRDLAFWTSTFGTLMTMTQSGNVGINTTSPVERLDLVGNATVSGNLTFYGGRWTIAGRFNEGMVIGDNQTGDVLINPNGNVGIGTTTPQTQLHTTGSIRFSGLSADTQPDALMVDSTGNLSKRTLNLVSFNGESDPVWQSAKTSSQVISGGWTFNANATTFSGADVLFPGNGVWNSNGNVGINTTSPAQKLDIGGAVKIGDGGTKPTCNASQRGTIWMDFGGTGSKDTVEICAKSIIDTYAWRNIY